MQLWPGDRDINNPALLPTINAENAADFSYLMACHFTDGAIYEEAIIDFVRRI